MVTIKNRKNQPYTINIPNQPALYVMAKEKLDVTEEQFQAPEMTEQINAGNILVVRFS